MEDDDEFGDLYTDVLRPHTTSFQSQYQESVAPVAVSSSAALPNPRFDLNTSRDGGTIDGVSDANTMKPNLSISTGLKFDASARGNAAAGLGPRLDGRRFDLNLDSKPEVSGVDALVGGYESSLGIALKTRVPVDGSRNLPQKDSGGFDFMAEENDINIVLEEGDTKDDEMVVEGSNLIVGKGELHLSAGRNETAVAMAGEGMNFGHNISRLSDRLENQGASNFDDGWESEESEDDLQIVLNDNSHVPIGMERMPGMHNEDEDGEPLVIVADNGDAGHHLHHQKMMMIEEQEWVGEEGLPGIDGEKKELGDTTKTGAVGGTATPATLQPRIGFSNHMYHHPFHSQFKYVRPGAPPLPGATPLTSGGISNHVRPPATPVPVAGRGRGDWRPAGLKAALPIQKGFHPGYGPPIWGANAAGRGYGSGLDFTLPSHKTIFEVDIDSFEDKPWNFPGIDTSDFFNFGLNENSWKDYCKQLEQLRLETSMQSKIRVYESGRAEQDYDPDLPPELAAAVGIQDITSENANHGNLDTGPTDLARESTRPALPVGRPIPVETGSGDRLPSTDTRRLRMHDSDAIIEIVCQGSVDDDAMIEHQDSDHAEKNFREGGEPDDIRQEQVEDINDPFAEYQVQKREQLRKPLSENISDSDGRTKSNPKLSVPYDSNQNFVGHHDGRSADGTGFVGPPKTIDSDNERKKETVGYHNEDSYDTGDGRQSPCSSFHASDVEQNAVNRDDTNDNSTMNDESFDVGTNQMAMDVTTHKPLEDSRSMQSSVGREKISSNVEQLSQDNDDRKDSKSVRSSESSKARSASSRDNSKDYRKFRGSVDDEVLQESYPRQSENIKKLEGDEDNVRRKGETGRHNSVMKGRDDLDSRKGRDDSDSSLRWHGKSGNLDWRKESDVFDGSRYRRDEDLQRGRIDSTKRMHGGDTGSRSRGKARESERLVKDEHPLFRKQLDNGGRRGLYQDQEMVSRQRDRDDYLKSRSEKDDYLHSKRRKEEMHTSMEHDEKEGLSYNHRESSIRRKREREAGTDHRKRDDQVRIKDADLYHARQKEESIIRDRSGRQKEHDEWHRHKKSPETKFSRREREETRSTMRSRQVSEDKTIINHSRGRDEYKGSGKDQDDVGRHTDQLKRSEWIEKESFSQQKYQENAYAQGSQFTNDEKRTRFERSGPRDERDAYFSDSSRAHEHRHRESGRKNREFESGDHNSLIPSKRTRDEHSGQISKTVNIRSKTEEQKDENSSQIIHQSSRKHGEIGSSDDEHPDSRKGRSKYERWTSHKERDFFITSMSSSSLNNKDPEAYSRIASLANGLPEESSRKSDDKLHPATDNRDNGEEVKDSKAKLVEDKHLDTVEKLKKRSERFKLPMPGEKESQVMKKTENEPLHSSQAENIQDSEIKSERPARKRRWTGGNQAA